jgi:hypothetical protein
MKDVLLSSLAEFFVVIGSQKAHWYRLLDPSDGDTNSSLILAPFPSLAFLMKMENEFMQWLLLKAGLARKKLMKQQSYTV